MTSKKPARNLTSLEYIILGLIGVEPQSGYSIMHFLTNSQLRWSASPGSIYPMLKRLEGLGVISGAMTTDTDSRPRKVYHLTGDGANQLDDWLRETPKMRPFYEERELAMLKFQLMETRFNVTQIVEWIDRYLHEVRHSNIQQQSYQELLLDALNEPNKGSLHKQLLLEAAMMEQNTLRTWLELVRARLTAVGIQTGEFRAIKLD